MSTQPKRQSLLEALKAVPDPRSDHGKRYQIGSVLAMAVCAMACGARSLYAVAQWGKLHKQLVCKALGIARLSTPSHSQLHRIFADLEVGAFEEVLGKWLAQRGLKKREAIALDGKTLRGIHGEEVPGVHLVAAYTHQSGIVLAQEAVEGAGRELAAVRAVLAQLDLQGHIITGDAHLAQRDICEEVGKGGGTTASD